MKTTVVQVARRGQRLLVAHLAVLLMAAGAQAQAQTTGSITGRVRDVRTGLPLAGAVVTVGGTQLTGTVGQDGRYRIVNVAPGSHSLRVTQIGFGETTQTVQVSANAIATADFDLQPAAIPLEEILVTGTAGSGARLRSIGNSVAKINAVEAVALGAPPNISTLINARAPGVVVNFATGRLGAGQSINIRGRSSLTLGNSPLIYLDGVRINSEVGGGTGPQQVSGAFSSQGAGVAGRLNDINPDDIESIEIIKGPAAATIYGTEASAGVIQIFTKKGVAGTRPVFGIQVEQGSMFFRDAAGRVPTNYLRDPANPSNIVPWNAVEAEDSLPLFRTGRRTGVQGSVSGGFDQARYYISSSYDDATGIEPNNGLKQFSLHANVNVTPSSKLDLATSLHFVDLRARLGTDQGASVLYGAHYGHPLFPGLANARGFAPGIAPEFIWELWDNSQKVKRFTNSNTISHRPTRWLSHRLNVGLDYTHDDGRNLERFAPPQLAAVAPGISGIVATGRIVQFLRNTSMFSIDYSGTATANVTSALSAATSLGLQTFRTEGSASQLGGTGFAGAGLETIQGMAAALPSASSQVINTTVGAYLQEKLSWRDRLFLTGAVRVDNNSAFGEDLKWVTYPKADFAWVISEEPFWNFGEVVNTLRLRAAYGESGRAPSTFSALRTFSSTQGPGGSNAVTPGSLGNPDLKPERGKEWEAGFEAELFRRFSLDFTYFDKTTEDLIVNRAVAPSSGFSGSIPTNLGRVDNHGIELRATLQALELDNVRWELSGSVATNDDVIKDVGTVPSAVTSASTANRHGYPIQAFWARKVFSAERNPTNGQAMNVLCADSAGTAGVACATAPFHFIGRTIPSTTGSVMSTMTFLKRLRLFAMFDFQRGNVLFNGNEAVRCAALTGQPLCEVNYYPERYPIEYVAAATSTAFTQHYIDQYIQDASYVKLREVSLSYRLPERWLRGLSDASITLAGRELHTWTKYKGLDPDFSQTTDQAITPQLTQLTVILNVKF